MLTSAVTVVSADPLQKDEINKKAFEKFKKEHTSVAPSIDNAVPSERFDGEFCLLSEKEFFQRFVLMISRGILYLLVFVDQLVS